MGSTFLLLPYNIPWPSLFSFHIRDVFKQDINTFFGHNTVTAYLINKIPKFHQSMVHTPMQLKGRQEDSSWLVWNNEIVPIPLAELTARRTYFILLERALAPHKAIEKFSAVHITVHWPSVWRSLLLWRFV